VLRYPQIVLYSTYGEDVACQRTSTHMEFHLRITPCTLLILAMYP